MVNLLPKLITGNAWLYTVNMPSRARGASPYVTDNVGASAHNHYACPLFLLFRFNIEKLILNKNNLMQRNNKYRGLGDLVIIRDCHS